ncbi:DUF2935 domain-containing protein [Tumebacillus permanentifrigoris]|uniref:DUF2935 family protein n=1 Tax=Tumebacillus permanentifrigoris TaxID=378543 RepID=A0A316D669_9BACL|nr:DUF2935 domain-containing protein [Tumebacillus permanentifrigoris]PWK10226.1 hypothetical protein C7459_11247 [Tumebacillus permanentifrigoris]
MAEQDLASEHQFWLTVLRDHTEFIKLGLAATEPSDIKQTVALQQEVLQLLGQLEHIKNHHDQLRLFTRQAADFTKRLLVFKQSILDRQLACKIDINLPPSLIDHMIREGEEYVKVMALLLQGRFLEGAMLAIHEASLWLPDSSGHAAVIRSNIDPQENDIFESAHDWKLQFDKLTLSLEEMKTKVRSEVRWVPSLERLMAMTAEHISVFHTYLLHLRETLEECRALGTLKPLLMDHMSREAAYFLDKLEQAQAHEQNKR